MCGFIGKFSYDIIDVNSLETCNSYIECRGPDSKVVHSSSSELLKYCFIFNRLSILDLAENANQPMVDEFSGNILMFNGEIFNHEELRKYLIKKGMNFKTSHSDTEVIIKGLIAEDIKFVQKLKGQFAIFYFDKNKNKAYLIRDRLGQKPLYFSTLNNSLVFGSNLKSLVKLNNSKDLDIKSLDEYLRYGVVSSPNTIFKNYYKVEPSQIIEVDFNNRTLEIRDSIYWDVEDSLDEKQFINEEFFEILNNSVKIRTQADVDIASILSGGLDSTAITKFISKSNNIDTFSVISDDKKYDESKWSYKVANKYKTQHKTISINSKISKEDIRESLDSLDEPYSDPSVIPSFKLYREISKHYKVAISGDGGDELLGGYKRTFMTLNNNPIPSGLLKTIYNIYPSFLGTGSYFLSKVKNKEESYQSTLSDDKFVKLLFSESRESKKNIFLGREKNLYKALLISDYKFFLPEQMLFKVDRTSMANSLEVRSPFLDHELIEYIMSHTANYLNLKRSKPILKDFLMNDFDKKFVERPKQGFVFDLESWIFDNLNFINDTFEDGSVVGNYFKNPTKKLSIYKSRVNALRIWKIYTLENYLLNF